MGHVLQQISKSRVRAILRAIMIVASKDNRLPVVFRFQL
jgi:hypothetical protein